MSAANQHIIQKSRLQLQMGGHLDAQQLQNRIMDIFQTRILPKMEAVLDSLAGPDVVLQFDRLELPLGALNSHSLDAQLEERILEHLREVILKALVGQGQGSSTPLLRQEAAAHALTQLLHFLVHGTTTWAHTSNRYAVDEAVLDLLENQPTRLLAALLPALALAPSRRRYQLQCSPGAQAAVLQAVHPAWRQAWEELPAWIAKLPGLLALLPGLGGPARTKAQVQDFVLELLAAEAADQLSADMRPLARALHAGHYSAAPLAKAWLAVQLDAVLVAGHPLPERPASALLPELQRIGLADDVLDLVLLRALAEAPADRQPKGLAHAPAEVAAALLLNQPLPQADRVRIVQLLLAADADAFVRLGQRFPRHAQALSVLLDLAQNRPATASAQEAASALEAEREAKLESEAEKQAAEKAEREKSPTTPPPATGSVSPPSVVDAPDVETLHQPGTQPAQPAPRTSKKVQKTQSERTHHSSPVTEHYVDHAGLVLLNPFFQHCFDGLGWLQGGDFADEARREDAVLLMAYIATGEWEHPEGTLALEKLLCGMPLDQPVRKVLDLPDDVLAEAENLIQSAVHYWDKLGNVSTESFRYTFLNREGVLRPTSSGWLLKVNRTGVDILTEFMPWGYGIVRLPWMKTLLSVDW